MVGSSAQQKQMSILAIGAFANAATAAATKVDLRIPCKDINNVTLFRVWAW
jgi:hypothetical protein